MEGNSSVVMTGQEFQARRRAAGIVGDLVCKRARISRTKLSTFERGYATLPPDDLLRVEIALKELVEAKQKVAQVALQYGWPVAAL